MKSENILSRESSKAAQLDAETSIRVHVSLLDSLMNLAGELVLSRNQLLQTIGSGENRNIETVGQRIDMITSELQEAIMLTRMQPTANVFDKFPRVIRDLSRKLGKKIDFEISGKDVELDKTIIEALGSPLTQLINNSVDHGIETVSERKKSGKAETGKIILRAFHEAGHVGIEISDDGKGLDSDALAEHALSKGLLSADQIQSMSMKEKVNVIFFPGFSTAAHVTEISGRGDGMDIVKTSLEKLGGNIEILSEVGKGTTISMKLPLTLAIIPCQIIMTSGERYAIPQVNLEELLRIPASKVKERIECVGDAQVVRLRGQLLPLIRLADIIGSKRTYTDPRNGETKIDRRQLIADRRGTISASGLSAAEDSRRSGNKKESGYAVRSSSDRRVSPASALNIVVVSTGAMKYGLIVDELQDSEEIVIKPLGVHLQNCKGYAGATIMGDGRIALILDVSNLSLMAKLTSVDGSGRSLAVQKSEKELLSARDEQQSFLIFRSSEKEQFAVKLSQVERIEKIKSSQIEKLGNKRIMQYRSGSLPLICMNDVAMVEPLAEHNDLLVIVFNCGCKPVGLLAIGPIDALEIDVDIDHTTLKQTGIGGSTIISGQTTMLVNVEEMIDSIFPDWADATSFPVTDFHKEIV